MASPAAFNRDENVGGQKDDGRNPVMVPERGREIGHSERRPTKSQLSAAGGRSQDRFLRPVGGFRMLVSQGAT